MRCNRKSIRLNKYDYSGNGYYFITICAQNRWNIFGEVKNKKMIPNDIGKMVFKIWNEIPNNCNGIKTDEFILMPDHLHGILVINKNWTIDNLSNGRMDNLSNGRTQGSAPTLGLIIKKFKTLTTKIFIDNVNKNNWPRFDKRLWQRNYYERIIRNEKEYLVKKQYIRLNPDLYKIVGVDPSVDL